MFERKEIQNVNFELSELSNYPELSSVVYTQHDFNVQDSEETIRITHAPKSADDNGLQFWLAAELQCDWQSIEQYFRPYIEDAEFKVITEAEFNRLATSQCHNLISKPTFPLNSGTFVGALAMYNIGSELIVDLFAEYENEYLHFIWESTA